MALEMKVYGEIRAYEAKIISGLSWRQLICVLAGVPPLAASSALLWVHARDAIVYVDFVIMLPFAAWGWWRPKALKPEKFFPYIYQRYAGKKVLRYEFRTSDAQGQSGREQRSKRRSKRAVRAAVRDLERGTRA
jgi:hypothetical protein